MTTSDYSEQRLSELLSALPPAPEAWVRAAQELPLARRSLDDIVERARADVEYRRQVLADLEAAVAQTGVEPDRRLVNALRRRFSEL
ncbi:MAG: hypothetical protein ICV59_04500 [Thermoleophilia bacterium]|nr:hypothetical protein [Thermoleophilia bacterium]